MKMGAGDYEQTYFGAERRLSLERRVTTDKRKYIRFDDSGGDRRSGYGRRSSDEGLQYADDLVMA